VARVTTIIVLVATILAVVLTPTAARPQPPGKVPRLGILATTSYPHRIEAFRDSLRGLGYEPGKNIVADTRSGPLEQLDALALELVRLGPDVIVTDSAPTTQAAKRATATIPIVFAATADPVGSGFVKSLAHPGGNITGITEITPELIGKRLQLLKEAIPALRTLAVIGNPGHTFHRSMVRGVEDAARPLALKVRFFEVRTGEEIDRALAAIGKERPDALLMLPHPLFGIERSRIAALALKYRLPSSVTSPEMVEAGGLIGYVPDYTNQFRRAATYVDKILKGARPTELPVEQPTTFELLINAKTAKALGLDLPRPLLLRADRIIE
jgi:putative ABC transport system substrate-binding protein